MKFLRLVILMISMSVVAFGQNGKIVGKITDAQTKEELPFVNVVIEGTTMGAASDINGFYQIINVPPGVYSLRVSAIGYQTITVQNIRVATGLTTTQDFKLTSISIALDKEIVVKAERPLVQKDMTASTAVVGADLIQELPVTEVRDLLQLQAGIIIGAGGDIHLRGGRKGQIAFQIDGVSMTDVYDGSSMVDVGANAIQELQVISGAFNAEYGQAMSGVVNIVTKDGSNNLGGNIQIYSGDYLSRKTDIFWNINNLNPIALRSIEGSLSGPIVKDNIFFYTTGRYYYNEGYLYGKRIFLVTDRAEELSGGTQGDFKFIRNGDGKYIPMNWNERIFGQGKLTWRISKGLKAAYNYMLDKQNYKDYDNSAKLTPDNNLQRFRRGYTNTLSINHNVTEYSFYTLSFSYFFKRYQHYLFKDIYTNDPIRPTRYVDNDILQTPPYSFPVGGTNYSRFKRNTGTIAGKLDWFTQATKEIAVQFGGEVKRHELFYHNLTLTAKLGPNNQKVTPFNVDIPPLSSPLHDKFTKNPFEAAAYIQSKVEAYSLIFNVGVRFDYFEPDGEILADPSDPDIYNPRKPENRAKSLEEREQYWYKRASAKYQFSPRLGLAFPITDKGVIHFSYGHFFQLPGYEYLYTNPRYKVSDASGNVGLVGNPDLKPQKTVKGEIGLQQQIGDDIGIDVTMFFEDFRDLTGTQTDEIEIFGGAQTYSQYANSDFGFSKGIVLKFEKRFAGGFAVNLDYTYSVTKGNSSNPADALNAILGGALPETYIAPLDWDQTHTFNLTIAYSVPKNYGISVITNVYSGQPYTPQVNKNTRVAQNGFPRNSANKPMIFNIDLRAYKDFELGKSILTVFAKVYNLLDLDNPRGVYGDTGDPYFTLGKLEAQKINPKLYFNTLDDIFNAPWHFSEPRRVELGLSFNF